jgi:hypothetical protein
MVAGSFPLWITYTKYSHTTPSYPLSTSGNRNRCLTSISLQGYNCRRGCNGERQRSWCTDRPSDGIRETLIYSSEHGHYNSVKRYPENTRCDNEYVR